jgi:hypothetical protein
MTLYSSYIGHFKSGKNTHEIVSYLEVRIVEKEIDKQINLTSAEISQLWATYMNDSASIPVLTYFLEKVEDKEIKHLIKYALQLSQSHVQKIADIFKGENYPIPYGFNIHEDVDLTAPRLFTDSYYLNFIHNMSKIGLNGHGMSLSISVRKDITGLFKECLTETIHLYEVSKDMLLSKGIYIRSPYIPKPAKVDFIKDQSFLSGFFGEKRPLTALEVTALYSNLQRNALGVVTMIGFGQVSREKEVAKFLKRGRDIARKHCEIFGGHLKKDLLPAPMTWDSDVTDSTHYVFSDKLMMFFTTILIGLGVQYYGQSIAISPRRDLGIMYNRLTAEIQLFSEDGANIMIRHGWLEEPPKAPDRDELAMKSKH